MKDEWDGRFVLDISLERLIYLTLLRTSGHWIRVIKLDYGTSCVCPSSSVKLSGTHPWFGFRRQKMESQSTFSTPVVSLLSTYLDSDGLYPYKLVSYVPASFTWDAPRRPWRYRNNTLVGTRHDMFFFNWKVEIKVGIAHWMVMGRDLMPGQRGTDLRLYRGRNNSLHII